MGSGRSPLDRPAIATTLSGVLTGHLLRSKQNPLAITCWMFVLGWGAILVGLVWGLVFPINKNLWTSSYVVFTSGAALQFLAVCYWLIDIRVWSKWAQPAVVFGMNAIAVFVLSGMLVKLMILIRIPIDSGDASAYSWIYQRVFVPWAGQLNGSLVFALANILLWYGMMSLLYRRKMFIKI